MRSRLITCLSLSILFFHPLPALAQSRVDRLEEMLEKYHEFGQLNGAVLAAQGDEIIYEEGFGDANMEWDVPNTPDTKFRIGSVTKQFTAALILQLVEEGKIDLEGTINDYLPDYPLSQGSRVTIHQLLTHTSGIPSYTGLPDFWSDYARDPFEPDSFLAVFSGLDLEFEPGTEYRYNNSGYFLLGAIIEGVTGKTYDQALQERILDPLGLRETGYDHSAEIIERRASGYVKSGDDYENAAYLDTSLPFSAGMMYSTVRDLLVWSRALHRGAPFQKEETLNMMITPYMQDYGYGLVIRDDSIGDRAASMILHGGGIPGFTTQLLYFPEEEFTVVVLDNTSGPSGGIAEAVAHVLYEQPTPEPKRSIADFLAEVIADYDIDEAVTRYRALKGSGSEEYDFSEPQLNMLGYHYLRSGETETAIRVFELNVEAYPEAFNTYDSLGEAYMEAGDSERAIKNYRKSLELNPENENAGKMLERLGASVDEPTR